MKKLLISFVVLVAVAGVALVILVGNLDTIINGAIEGIGSELLGVPVTVQSVELDLKTGSGQISGLTIANPAGYTATNAFKMDTVRLGLDIGSLQKQPLIINELTVVNPIVELEAKEDGNSNLRTLLDNIKKNSEQTDEKAAEQQPKSEDAVPHEPAKLRFKRLSITGVTVNAVVPGKDPATLVLPDVAMENVGGTEGLTPAKVGSLIIGNIIGQSLKASLKKEMTEYVEEATRGMIEKLKQKPAK